jgi:hypothetical protein
MSPRQVTRVQNVTSVTRSPPGWRPVAKNALLNGDFPPVIAILDRRSARAVHAEDEGIQESERRLSAVVPKIG